MRQIIFVSATGGGFDRLKEVRPRGRPRLSGKILKSSCMADLYSVMPRLASQLSPRISAFVQ